MKTIFSICLFASLTLAGVLFAEPDPPRFAIYRVDLVPSETTPIPSPFRLTQEVALSTAVRHEVPILTEAHILEFCWDIQRVTLTDEGARRWNKQGGFDAPLTGLPLVVYVDEEPRYAAMLWNPLSSLGCRLPQIWCQAMDGDIRIAGMVISAEGDTTLRANYDPEVKSVLEELGILVDSCTK
jgi:hypothetical protein